MDKNSAQKNADIIIFTDGASSGNPGPGGWGAVVATFGPSGQVTELGGGEKRTTNNRMELAAAIGGLAHIAGQPGMVIVYTDSKYVRDGMEKWVATWQKRGWKTTAKADVLNRDLWEQLAALADARVKNGSLEWRLVGGHRDVAANERADVISVAYAAGKVPSLYNAPLAKYSIDLANFFSTATLDAELLGKHIPSKSKSSKSSSAKAYSYVSMVNKQVLVHETWPECFARINGVSGARFKKALSSEDEKKIMAEFKSL